ncbi:MAG: uracil-DNA glycosylase [Phycisphaerales bacterium]
MSSLDEAAARVVRQHARTSSLMGVEFVPVYRVVRADSVDETTTPTADAVAGGASTEAPPVASDSVRALKARRLEAIRERYLAEMPHAPFISTYTNIVFGEGDPAARLMFVGEAPGFEEDRTGRPFVGRAGQLLDKMIVAMGLKRSDVYIANVLKVRPPDNATPTIEEAEASAPFLYDQIEAIAPEALVTLGLPATRTLLKTSDSMGRLRGHWATFTHPGTGFTCPVMPTFHPAFLLRQYTDENRAKVWSDLKQVMVKLGLGAR